MSGARMSTSRAAIHRKVNRPINLDYVRSIKVQCCHNFLDDQDPVIGWVHAAASIPMSMSPTKRSLPPARPNLPRSFIQRNEPTYCYCVCTVPGRAAPAS